MRGKYFDSIKVINNNIYLVTHEGKMIVRADVLTGTAQIYADASVYEFIGNIRMAEGNEGNKLLFYDNYSPYIVIFDLENNEYRKVQLNECEKDQVNMYFSNIYMNGDIITFPFRGKKIVRYDLAGRVIGTVDLEGNSISKYGYKNVRQMTASDKNGNIYFVVNCEKGDLICKYDLGNNNISIIYEVINGVVFNISCENERVSFLCVTTKKVRYISYSTKEGKILKSVDLPDVSYMNYAIPQMYQMYLEEDRTYILCGSELYELNTEDNDSETKRICTLKDTVEYTGCGYYYDTTEKKLYSCTQKEKCVDMKEVAAKVIEKVMHDSSVIKYEGEISLSDFLNCI